MYIGLSADSSPTTTTGVVVGEVVEYETTVTARFLNDTITDTIFGDALVNLNPIPLTFDVYSLGGNFLEMSTISIV